MIKILIVYLSLLFSVAVSGQTATNAVLFKISGNGLKSPSYILGSFHIMRGETVSSIPEFEKIYKAIPQVCFETDMNQSPSSTAMGEEVQPPQAKSMAKLTPQEILLPADSTYDKIIGAEKAAEVDTVMKMVFPMYVSNMRPTYAAMILQMMYSVQMLGITQENRQKGFTPIDYYVHAQAVSDGKSIEMLEPFAVQDSILKKMKMQKNSSKKQTLAEEMNSLFDFCHTYSSKVQLINKLKKLYAEGKGEDVMLELQNNQYASGLTSGLLDVNKRNAEWMKKIPQMIKTKPTLIVVGLAHLLKYKDSEGIVANLKSLGYKVEPIK